MALDPTLRELNDCGCCEGVTAETPALVFNRPGLPAVNYRAGEHASFLRTMLASLSGTPNAALSRLQTREGDDLSIALLDAWATAADVLTFYNERIANESYLRTATERLSVLHLARLIGYELAPGVAARTSVAFNLETAPGAPQEVTLDPGIRLQSIPGPGETAQVFETVETITARPGWNAIRPRLTAPVAPNPAASTVYLAGTATNLKAGDRLLIAGSSTSWTVRAVATVTAEDAEERTKVTLHPATGGMSAAPAGLTPGVWALRVKTSPFGHNAPKKPDPDEPGDLDSATEWTLAEASNALSLDAVHEAVAPGSWIVIDRFWYVLGAFLGLPFPPNGRINLLLRANQVNTLSRANYGITGRVTHIGLSGDWLHEWETSLYWWVRLTNVYAGSELLTLAEAPLPDFLGMNDILAIGDLSALPAGRSAVVSGLKLGQPAEAARTSELVEIESATFSGGHTTLRFKKALVTLFDRKTVTINANVAAATQGETVSEVLGGGDPATGYQAFKLKQGPLTHTAEAGGIVSSLSVRVNDLLWQQAPTLWDRKPGEHIYVARSDNNGQVTVRFGDGESGARLPRGVDNVTAAYRKGAGVAGNVKAGQVSLLLTRPLGVKDVVNPLPASGGADPETQEDARENAPVTVLTLGRVVSLRDYEDFARGFPGIAKALASWTWDGRRRGIMITVAGPDGALVPVDGPTWESLSGALADAGDPYVPVRLRSFTPVQFILEGTIVRRPDALAENVKQAVTEALLVAYSFDARALGQPVALSEVVATIQAVFGVVGVDIDELRRPGQAAGVHARLPAFAPVPGADSTLGAELLTIDTSALSLGVS